MNSLTNTIMRDGLVHHVELMKHAQGELENLEQEIKNGMINTPRPDGEWYPVRGDKKRNVMSRFVDKEETSELFVSDANKKNIQWLHYAVTDRMVFSFSIKGYADNDFSAFAHKHQVPGEGYDFNFFGDGHIATATGFGLPGVLEFHPNGRLQRFTMKPQIITTNATWLYTGDFYEALWDENGKLVKSNETHPTPESIARAKKVASWFKPEKGEQ